MQKMLFILPVSNPNSLEGKRNITPDGISKTSLKEFGNIVETQRR